ncbi:MAG TPA: DUF4238 domain-containing protein [Candidatus Limnocylindrales bacterium]|nr:DUF4238 domain-containing protein [Candidatus Limnocylindrales bacterium]
MDQAGRLAQGKHFLSRALLKRFEEPVARGTGRPQLLIAVVDVDTGRSHLKGKDGCGRYEELVKFDQDVAETHWGELENRLHPVYEALADGSLLSHPELVATVRDLVALHWARNPEMRLRSDATLGVVAARQRAEMIAQEPDKLAKLFYEQHGIHAAGREALEMAVRAAQEPMHEVVRSGQWFSVRVHHFYERARELLVNRELLLVRAGEGEFVLGDAPVVLTGPSDTNSPDVAIAAATDVRMPIDPRWMVILGDRPGTVTYSLDEVLDANSTQVGKARRHTYMRPGSPWNALIIEAIARVAANPLAPDPRRS